MRRKSERNKSKGSPEKKVEKATRKSTRKRGKRATTSSSPEKDNADDKLSKVVAHNSEIVEEVETIAQPAATTTATTRLKIKELKTIVEEELTTKQVVGGASSEPTNCADKVIEETEGGGGGGGSVWKVARADASPGEIQKLKLCRQRKASEASDSSSSRKKSHKSYESGEGDGDEGDSADDAPKSDKKDSGEARQDDPSSSSNPGQDSKEEVSHCSEILPRTTSSSSANFCFLSDDKKNVDRTIADDNDAQAIRYEKKSPVQKPQDEINAIKAEPSFNGDDYTEAEASGNIEREDLKDIVKEEEKDGREAKSDDSGKMEVKEEEGVEKVEEEKGGAAEIVPQPKDKINEGEDEPKEASGDDEDKFKKQNTEPAEEVKARTEIRSSSRTVRRKPRNKYHEPSDSDTPESEDEPAEKKIKDTKSSDEINKEVEKARSRSTSPDNRLGFEAAENLENKIVESGESNEERINKFDDKTRDDTSTLNAQTADYKPAKVNLKRSFSARSAETDEVAKKEDADKNGESEVSLRVKENHGTADETEAKNLPRKRRWGTTVTTNTAEAVPTFTVSTDSLKALVPGAKPLSMNEVRLSKDDDEEEKARRKDREKRHSVGDDGDEKIRDEGAATKNDGTKKGDLKHDNHIGAKRKISILKDAPRVKSPSPPSAKATDVLLIKNLVRPFTLNQIKELLSRTGTIVENGFWIDGIKSKCYVAYSNEDQAFETRQALHGISWPVSNPKRLHVEYASKEDMDAARELSKDQPVVRKAEPLPGGDNWQQVWAREDKQNVAVKVTTVREWDLGKEEDGHRAKEKEREKKDLDKKRRQRSRSPGVEPHLPPPARKFKKKEDEPPPAKLLDDLFKKTRAIPCIYWLPLTNEQIVVKEEMRRQHMAEHARRLEEMKRAERSRDPASRRRRSPRK